MDTVYFRLYSAGDYTGAGFGAAQAYDYGSGINPLAFTSYTLSNSNYNSYELAVKLLQDVDYLQPYYAMQEYYNSGTDICVSKNLTEYYVFYMSYDYIKQGIDGLKPTQDSVFIAQEQAYRDFVYQNYTTIDLAYAHQLLTILQKNGISLDSETIIADIAEYVRGAAPYNLKFKPFPEGVDPIIYFLTAEGAEGICQHYAAAATMLYRAAGIPARYTVGYMAETQANMLTEVKASNAHAWVEVYLGGIGWVAVEVTGGADDFKPDNPDTPDQPDKPQALNVSVVTPSAEKIYDGTSLSNTENILVSGLPDNYTWEISSAMSATNVGVYANMVYINVYDENGKPVKIKQITECGTLTITTREISITTDSALLYGDVKTVLEKKTYTVVGLQASHKLTVEVTGRQVGYGVSDNTLNLDSIIIVDADGRNVTRNYKITIKLGKLTVFPEE